jgi:radical SAM superfamily enzyme YgiQ (UPF0313 family)
MKTTLIFPPQWIPINPHLSIASLSAQLRHNGYEVAIKDLNVEFYDTILKKDFINNAINKAFNMESELLSQLSVDYSLDKKSDDYSDEFKKKVFKYNKIKEFREKRLHEVMSIPDVIEESVNVMRNKEKYYQPELLVQALNNIDTAIEMASLPFFPAQLEFFNYRNQFFKMTFESIKIHCKDRLTNMFIDFLESKLQSIIDDKPDLIGISINSSTQIIPGLTLSQMLKERLPNTHINIGGNFFGRVTEELSRNPEFFELYADSVSVDEGEAPIIELAKHVEGSISIDKVPNLLYLENNVVKITEKIKPMKLNDMKFPDLDGFPLELYLTPEIVLSIQASRGCYWKQCSFCDHDFGQNYNLKDVDLLVQQIKDVNKKHNISRFEFIDESISPKYLQEMSTKILDAGLKINWFNNARLEREFSAELLQHASSAGLRMVLWGVESGSRRIMDLINKGIDLDQRLDVLRDSHDANIWNFAFIFFGFPGETPEDAMETVKLLCDNVDIISSYGKSIFTLGKHTRLRDDPEKYGITEILKSEEELSPSYIFKTSSGMNADEVLELSDICTQKCCEAYDNPLWMYIRYREILFLYISHFGAKTVQDCKISFD